MAQDNETGGPGDASGQINPALTQLAGSMQTPEGQAWMGDAARGVQDYLTQKALTTQANEAAASFTNNLADTKNKLVGMVQNDPGAIDLALGLAEHTVNGLVDQHQHLDDDARGGAAADLTAHMHTEIVHAGVAALADQDKPTALAALDRYDQFLPDDQQASLRQYADTQEALRGQDAAAVARQQQRDTALAGYQSATTYLAGITDPNTNGFRAAPGFLSSLHSDQTLSLPTRLALHAGYTMLANRGDVAQSNPHVAADMLTRIGSDDPPQQGEIFSHLGSGLSVSDANFLNTLIAPANPQRQADLRELGNVVSQARSTLADPRNGPGGRVAFGRFANWLMPALQRGANLTDLMADNRIQQFAPTPADAVPVAAGPRPPLHMIFGNG